MRRTSVRSAVGALLLTLVLALLGAASASAGQLTNEGGTWVYRAAPGESNLVRIAADDQRSGYVHLRDEVGLGGVPQGCYQQDWDDARTVRCPAGPIRFELADGDDTANVSDDIPAGAPVTVDGGPGVDTLRGPIRGQGSTFLGGDGNDQIDGGAGNDTIDGGPGNDRLEGETGNDVVRGGDGDDTLSGDGVVTGSDVIDGGAGTDVIESEWIQNDRSGFLTVTLDGVANDGHPGENDNVISVETITVREPAALIAGADAVTFKIDNTASGSSQAIGGPGDDNLRTYDYADTIDGRGGNDTIEGGYGDDTITGGPGRDTINAEAGTGSCNFLVCRSGSGNDTIQVRDGEVDSVVCGVGTDTVVADANDTVAADCETVDRGPATQQPPPPDRNRGGGERRPAKRCVVPKLKAGVTLAAAKKALKKRGCKAKVKKARSGKVRRGRLVKVSARAGKKLKPGATVTIVVSRGR